MPLSGCLMKRAALVPDLDHMNSFVRVGGG
jgi:hypothetical protein